MEAATLKRLEQLILSYDKTETNTDIPTIVTPDNNKVVSLEPFKHRPSMHRAVINAQRIADFNAYAAGKTDGNSALFINPANLNALLVFDYLDNWGKHKANLKLKPTAEYLSVKDNPTLNQQSMREWLEDFGESIVAHTADDAVISNSIVFQAVEKVEIKSSNTVTSELSEFKATRSGLEEIEAKGAAQQLPAYFILTAPLFEGMDKREIKLKLAVRWDDKNKPLFYLRIIAHDKLLQEVTQELEDKLKVIAVPAFVGELVSHQ
jgi:uncharacterized protein YfdQ (DUF2303 family)